MKNQISADYSQMSYEDIIFENRNKAYGAYDLRMRMQRHTLIGMTAMLAAALVLGLLPYMASRMNFSQSAEITQWLDDTCETIIQLTNIKIPVLAPVKLEIPAPAAGSASIPPVSSSLAHIAIVQNDQIPASEKPMANEAGKNDANAVTGSAEAVVGEGGSDPDQSGGVSSGAGEAPLAPAVIAAPAVKEEKIMDFADQMPEFPGGNEALIKFMAANMKYPAGDREQGIEGTVYVKFVVDEQGHLNEIKCLRSPSAGLEKEAIRVVRLLPDFIPGKQRGKPVKVYFNLPIRFKLN